MSHEKETSDLNLKMTFERPEELKLVSCEPLAIADLIVNIIGVYWALLVSFERMEKEEDLPKDVSEEPWTVIKDALAFRWDTPDWVISWNAKLQHQDWIKRLKIVCALSKEKRIYTALPCAQSSHHTGPTLATPSIAHRCLTFSDLSEGEYCHFPNLTFLLFFSLIQRNILTESTQYILTQNN